MWDVWFLRQIDYCTIEHPWIINKNEDTLTLIQPVEAGYAHLLELPPLDLEIFRWAYRDELCEKCIGIDNCYGESENRIETTASG